MQKVRVRVDAAGGRSEGVSVVQKLQMERRKETKVKISELVSNVAQSGKLKKEHYSWEEISDTVRHEVLNISDINIPDYQRGEASRKSTIAKARSYSNAASGACVVARRTDGTYWIVDGLQRTLSRAIRGDASTVDCMVFDSEGEKHEARIFKLCNIGRVNVSAIHKYKVSVTAGDEPDVSIERWLSDNGMRIDDGQHKNCVGFISHLKQNWQLDSEAAKRALLFCREVESGQLDGQVFVGACTLIRHGVNVEQYAEKIVLLGGRATLLRDINAVAIELGVSKNWTVCAHGILKSINHKKRNKVKMTGMKAYADQGFIIDA